MWTKILYSAAENAEDDNISFSKIYILYHRNSLVNFHSQF